MKAITNFDELPVVLNAKHVAKVLGISEGKAYNLCHSKEFPTTKVGSRLLVGKKAFIKWIEESAGKTFDV